jgi:CheY-like chemotaxis protein
MGRTALVVDDSMLIRHTVCRFLEERGFMVESATNGAEAVEILSSVTPDIIITDLSMPKMNGSELITFIKGRQDCANTPIVVLAAKRTSTETITEDRADALIHKDIDIDEQLEEALEQLLEEEDAPVIER